MSCCFCRQKGERNEGYTMLFLLSDETVLFLWTLLLHQCRFKSETGALALPGGKTCKEELEDERNGLLLGARSSLFWLERTVGVKQAGDKLGRGCRGRQRDGAWCSSGRGGDEDLWATFFLSYMDNRSVLDFFPPWLKKRRLCWGVMDFISLCSF